MLLSKQKTPPRGTTVERGKEVKANILGQRKDRAWQARKKKKKKRPWFLVTVAPMLKVEKLQSKGQYCCPSLVSGQDSAWLESWFPPDFL